VHHIEPGRARMLDGFLCELDAGHIVVAGRFHEKEAVRASQLQQPAAASMATNERNAARKLVPQYGLGPGIIGIAVRVAAPEIIRCIIGDWIEFGCICRTQPAAAALEDVAAVHIEAKTVLDQAAAGETVARDRRMRPARRISTRVTGQTLLWAWNQIVWPDWIDISAQPRDRDP
jgi:hypothetical protein